MAIIDLVGMWWKEGKNGDYLSGAKLSRKELIAKIEEAVEPDGFVVLAVFSTTKKTEKSPDKKLCMMTSQQGEQRQPERQREPARKPEPDYYPPPPEDDIPF